ncbi:phenylalanine-tRNA ligase beta subunit [Ceratobasidium sp. AG-Ba]|nr:phenylalanine-tRNA ligase beta subunit [Ceratobasidium sp. AG-Ba]
MDTVLPHRRKNTWTANQFPAASTNAGAPNMPYENLEPHAGAHIEIGSELSAEAPVWKAYVLESDRQDKEMCDDWDRSLDVLLVRLSKAALFSAISTAFILESMKKLQPDPADITASTLLDISRTLVAISNGQPPPLPNITTSEPAPFTPSPATIWINSLWFASLALSLSVSLMAMLAKKWCHKFMSKRSGPHHEQARRRQMRWDGILRWRMQGVMDVLPALMHIALALFVTGLVVLLWDTNQQVALPVIVISSVFFALYVAITILPTISISCPYETALSEAFKWLLLVSSCTLLGARAILLFTRALVIEMWDQLTGNGDLAYVLREEFPKIGKNTLHKIQSLMHLIGLRSPLSDMDERHSPKIPMDDTTSGALYWLISNSEHGDHVNIGLQAISGAELHMMDALRKGWIVNQIGAQLRMRCMGATKGNAAPSHAGHHKVLVSLFRALSRALATDPRCYIDWDDLPYSQWREYLGELDNYTEVTMLVYEVLAGYQDSDPPKDEVTAHNVAAVMMIYHCDRRRRLDFISEPVSSAIRIANRHLNGNIVLSRSALVALSEGFMYFILREIFNKGDQTRVKEALIILIQIYLQQSETSSKRLRYTIAVALASAALAFDSNDSKYIDPINQGLASHPAVKLLCEYVHKEVATREDPQVVRDLFFFGLTQMLPSIGYSICDNDLKMLSDECKQLNGSDVPFLYRDQLVTISTPNPPLPWRERLAHTIVTCLQQLPIIPGSMATETTMLKYMKALSGDRGLTCPNGTPTRNSVQGLCNVRSDDLWDFGLKFFKLDPSRSREIALRRMGQCELLEQLSHVSRNSESPVSPLAMRRLLGLIKVVTECRQAAPESIQSAFASLEPSIEVPSTPAEIVIKLSLEEIWYERLDAMISSEDVQEVDGGIIQLMIEGYIPEESVREKWHELGRRLEAGKEMARQETAEPEGVEAESAGAGSSGQAPVESEGGGLPY